MVATSASARSTRWSSEGSATLSARKTFIAPITLSRRRIGNACTASTPESTARRAKTGQRS